MSQVNPMSLCSERLDQAANIVLQGLKQGLFTAAVLHVSLAGVAALERAWGAAGDPEAPASAETLFDLASLTKPVVAAAALRLAQRGDLLLSQPLATWFPETGAVALGRVTLRQLALHVSGLPPWRPLYESGRDQESMLCAILRTPLEAAAGSRYAYSDLGYILLGEVVARTAGHPLSRAVHDLVLAPLRLDNTLYLPGPPQTGRCARTAHCPLRPGRQLVGEVHDANAHFLGGVAGHAGLFGSAGDMAAFAAAIAGFGARRLLGLPALRLARENQIDPSKGGQTVGWFAPPNPMLPAGDLFGARTFGHTGFTGGMILADPDTRVVVVLLTNRVISAFDSAQIIGLRRRVANAVAGAITEHPK